MDEVAGVVVAFHLLTFVLDETSHRVNMIVSVWYRVSQEILSQVYPQDRSLSHQSSSSSQISCSAM